MKEDCRIAFRKLKLLPRIKNVHSREKIDSVDIAPLLRN